MKFEQKKEIYAGFGIEIKKDGNTEKIFHPVFGWINKLLVDGNQKIGKGCFHFSTLPTNQIYHVVIDGKKANIIGRVCMDQMMVDVTDIENIQVGNEVILFGDKDLTIDDYSKLCNTINYETVCLVGKRVPRVYFENGKEVGVVNFIYNQKD